MANSLLSRELPKSFSFRNAFVNFTRGSIVQKRPFQTSIFPFFACKSQLLNTRRKLAATQIRAYSVEQTNQTTPDRPVHKSENNNQPKHTITLANKEVSSRFIPIYPIILILAASVSFGLYKYYATVLKYPKEIRKNLRKGLFYHGRDPSRAVNFYQTALTQAFNHEELDNASPEVTGIMIQLGGLYEELGRTREAIDVFTMAYDVIVRSNNIPAKLKDEMKIRSISLAQKLGDLHQSLKQYEQAERHYVWSVEQLLQSQQAELTHNQSGFFSRKNDIPLPSWMTSTDLGASLEALASFYSSQHKYTYALPLYLRALSLINPPESSCHAAVLMNNISEVFTGMGNLEEAQGWAERGLKLVENFRPKRKITRECDESCGVLLFNLGMISELSGSIGKAHDYYEKSLHLAKRVDFKDCVNEAELALRRTAALLSEQAQ